MTMDKQKNWITPYSTYLISRYGSLKTEINVCENCKKFFATNIGRKRCSPECAKKAKNQNKRS